MASTLWRRRNLGSGVDSDSLPSDAAGVLVRVFALAVWWPRRERGFVVVAGGLSLSSVPEEDRGPRDVSADFSVRWAASEERVDEPADAVSSDLAHATPGDISTADPIPSATANAPTRPT